MPKSDWMMNVMMSHANHNKGQMSKVNSIKHATRFHYQVSSSCKAEAESHFKPEQNLI